MDQYERATVSAIHEALKRGEATSAQCVRLALERVARLDKEGPNLNAVLEINPQAEQIAEAMDAEIRAGRVRGPLHGVPVLLKDNVDTDDMTHTSAGSLALRNRYAPRDAFVAEQLRNAGAVLLGKANMTEFANYIADGMPNGFSSRGGQVKNPWGDIDPGGSSTGSAVAVAAGYVPISIGTETLGSIIYPAGQNGIAAIKPTVGLISRSGVLPISISQDTAGPIARTVLDCAILLDAVAGPDPRDAATLHGKPHADYADAVINAPGSLSGIVVGLDNRDEDGNHVETEAFMAALDALRALGATIADVEIPKYPGKDVGEVLRNEFRACMDFALRGSIGCPRTLAEIAAYNLAHAESCLPYGQASFDKALRPEMGFANPSYIRARKAVREELGSGIAEAFAKHGISALITPVCSYFAAPGFPSVTIPVGLHNGYPVPLVLNGLAFSERTLLTIASALERAVACRVFPPLDEFSTNE